MTNLSTRDTRLQFRAGTAWVNGAYEVTVRLDAFNPIRYLQLRIAARLETEARFYLRWQFARKLRSRR